MRESKGLIVSLLAVALVVLLVPAAWTQTKLTLVFSSGPIEVPEEFIEQLRKLNRGFVRHVIPKGTYLAQGIHEAVVTFQTPLVLTASSKTPAAIYKVTRAIIEGRENFANVTAAMKGVSARDMARDFGMPYHPGAEKYYREVDLLR